MSIMSVQIESYEEERVLLENILKVSISDYLNCKSDSEEYFNVCIWLFDDHDEGYPTINDTCYCLQLDKFTLRLEIKKMLDKGRLRLTSRAFTNLLLKCSKEDNQLWKI